MRTHDWQAMRQSLGGGHAITLEAGGEHKKIRLPIEASERGVRQLSDQINPIGEAELADAGTQVRDCAGAPLQAAHTGELPGQR